MEVKCPVQVHNSIVTMMDRAGVQIGNPLVTGILLSHCYTMSAELLFSCFKQSVFPSIYIELELGRLTVRSQIFCVIIL